MTTLRRSLLCAALGALALTASASPASATERLVRVDLDNPRLDISILEQKLGLDVTHNIRRTYADVLLHDDADLATLRDNGFTYTVRIADGEAAARRARLADERAAATGARSALPSGRETYRVMQDYLDEMDQLAAENPGLVRRITLPKKTVEGRDITGVEISEGVTATTDGKPVFVTMGVHHAREWPSAEMNIEFARDLVARYKAGEPRWKRILQRTRIFVIPVINVDGFLVSRGTDPANVAGGAERNRRKSCAYGALDPEALPCRLRRGVDLNRNYGAYWGGNGASTVEAEDTYRGPGPWSEPETQAVHEFSQRLQIMNFQTIHNVASLVLRPPGFRAQGLAPDEAGMKALGDAMAAATGYSSEYGYQLYEVTGATEDWNYDAQGAYAYTIETGGNNFNSDPYDLGVVRQYNGTPGTATEGKGVREALLLAAEQTQTTDDHGIVAGNAPAGATLRLRKTFTTTTSPICQNSLVTIPVQDPENGVTYDDCLLTSAAQTIPDFLDTTTVVPSDGAFTWHVGQSTRPFKKKAGMTEQWTLTCEIGGQVVATRAIEIDRGQVLTVDPCVAGATPTTRDRPPVVADTSPAAAVGETTATLAGTVNPNGDPGTGAFEYGTTTAYGTTTTTQDVGDGATPRPVTQDVTGLTAATTYHYRTVGTGRGGTTVYGPDRTFTTAAAVLAPAAATLDATDVTSTGAILVGTADPNGSAATLRFEYGTTTAYGTTTSAVDAGAGEDPVQRTTAVTGLQPQTTYHYRAIVSSAGGTVQGADRTFTTGAAAPVPLPPTAATLAATDLTTTTATLRGTVDLQGRAGTVRFTYGTTSALGTLTREQDLPASDGDTPVSAAITGLAADTAYSYRVIVTTADGTVTGPLQPFRTAATATEPEPEPTATPTPAPPAPAPAGPAATPTPAATPRPAAFTSSFAVDRQRVSSVRSRGLRVRTRCSAACFLQLTVTVDTTTARRLRLSSRTLARRSIRYSRATRRVVTLRPFTAARRALRGRRGVRATVKVVVTAADGTARTRTLRLRLT